jgi:3-hydroxyacyl-[acyl-carrier-protein] dehydratase
MKFRMIDQILGWEKDRKIRGVKAVSFEEYSMKSPLGTASMGERERLPESLVLESVCQLGNWLVVLSSDFTQMAQMIGIDRAEFISGLGPGERMDVEVQARQLGQDMIRIDGAGQAGTRWIVRVSGMEMKRVPLDELQDPDDLRILFSEIHRPGTGAGTGAAVEVPP